MKFRTSETDWKYPMRGTQQIIQLAAFMLLSILFMPLLYGQTPASQPSVSHAQLMKNLNVQFFALCKAIPDDQTAMRSADERDKVGHSVIPIVKKALAIIDQIPPNCRGESMSAMKTDWEPLLIVFGDKQFTESIQKQAIGTGESTVDAQLCLAMADATLAFDDRSKLEESVKKVVELANQNPKSDRASMALIHFLDDDRLTPEMKKSVQSALDHATSPVAQGIRLLPTTKPSQ